ncbi:PQQ-dependent sugar dehydrogenase [Kordiimonas laminariae]|uniref:PQQ-dependent sugar dehydrogenase n=1 Tax=Kordiimonas laminariae TaxID=2917717 RepID=UPI001FF50035|nr:PQQ-dependent sugar dehydrogenase [Kordiimonas laminariae]MCK0068447.1 PQQ-dependent sugar dehydrogenase [Kordiimonas laminariae]
MLKKIGLGFLVLLLVLILALWIFWPKNLNIGGPLLDFVTGKQLETPDTATMNARFQLPDGFKLGVFAENVAHARMMRTTSRSDLVVSSMREGKVILLHADDDGDGRSDGRTVLLEGLDVPHGLALQDGYLYVAETHRIIRVPFAAATRKVGAIESVFEGLPPGGNHRTRTIGFGPDGWLYVTIGSSCNVCIEEHEYRAAMLRMRPDGSEARIYATGLRNTVGFDWHPTTGKLYGTDNGRDLLGDDTPHCEINQIEEGQSYGWPYTYDDKQVDPDFGLGNEDKIAASKAMVHGLGAHVAPLGIKFLKPNLAPEEYDSVALVALHGSWNRSKLSGYKVVSLHYGDDGSIEQRDFLTGFEENEDVIGRPVDIEQGLDGAIYISDDYSGTIYRVGWGDIRTSAATEENGVVRDPFEDLGEDSIRSLSAVGEVLYREQNCASCHEAGQAGEGVQVKLLQGLQSRYTLSSLQALLDTPPGPMPRPDISDEERKALAAYLLSTR